MKFEAPKNINYAATIVKLADFVDLPNCDNVKSAIIFGNSVIVPKTSQPGTLGVFFSVECQLNSEFLSNNNLYRHSEWGNIDPLKTGFFELHGRVKAVRFRGHKSEGFWLPISCLSYVNVSDSDVSEGLSFDKVGNHEICKKYIPTHNPAALSHNRGKKNLESSIVEGQFRFHFDTDNLRRNIHKIKPTDIISISDKWHGTSVVISKSLINRNLAWYEKLLRKIGIKIDTKNYGLVYSSRKVVKGVNGIDKSNGRNFYKEDIYGRVAENVVDKIPNSYTLYGEIVGYTSNGKPIQSASGGRAYHYGCANNEHKFVVYRVVTTNIDGKTLELSWPQMNEFCKKYGLTMVHEWFYGRISELFPIETNLYMTIKDESVRLKLWQTHLLKFLELEYANDGMCQFNNNEVPAEGVVVRRDGLTECESWKLKNFKFLEDETKKNDSGVTDMETIESITESSE